MILAVLLFVGGTLGFHFLKEPTPGPPPVWMDGRPARWVGRVASPVEPRRGGDVFRLDVRWVAPLGAAPLPLRRRVLVYRKNPKEIFHWGDTVTLWGTLSPSLRTGGAPFLFVPVGKAWRVRAASWAFPGRWAESVRERLRSIFEHRLRPRTAAVLSGLFLGHRSTALEDLSEDFRRSGTIHLLVASGSNVAFVVGLWWFAARWLLGWPHRWMLAAVPFWAFFYAGVAGADPPVLRAAWMASLLSIGHLLGRWDRPEQALFLSAGILLAWDPAVLWQAGFQMSYAATWGIVTYWSGMKADPSQIPPEGFFLRWRERMGRGLGVSVAAQWALAPLLLYYFGRFSVAGLWANPVSIPLAEVSLALGVGLAGAQALGWTGLASGFSWAIEKTVGGLLAWTHWAGEGPWSEIQTPLCGWAVGVLLAGCAAGLILWSRGRRFWAVGVAGVAVGGAFLWGRPSPFPGLRVLLSPSRNICVQTPAGDTVVEFIQKTGPVHRGARGGFGERRRWRFSKAPFRGSGENLQVERWREGPVVWAVSRLPGSPGALVVLERGPHRAIFGFFVSQALARSFARQTAPFRADVAVWAPLPGAPGAADLLVPFAPRRVVFLGKRPSRALRAAAGSSPLLTPGRKGGVWAVDDRGERWNAWRDESIPVAQLGVW